MPFGVTTHLLFFVRVMFFVRVIQGLLWIEVAVLLDDIVTCIKGKFFRSTRAFLKEVLQRLCEVEITVKSSKVTFCHKKLIFLGHQVSDKGILPDLDGSFSAVAMVCEHKRTLCILSASATTVGTSFPISKHERGYSTS